MFFWVFLFAVPGAVKKEVYFMAIIDILTHYDAKKKAAHAAKTVKHGVSAKTYRNPLQAVVTGGRLKGRLSLQPKQSHLDFLSI